MAKSLAATLAIAIEAQTAELKKGLADATKAVRGWRGAILTANQTIQAATTALSLIRKAFDAVTRSISGTVRTLAQFIDEVSMIQKAADRANVSFQQFTLWDAMLPGADFRSIEDGFITLIENIGEARREAGSFRESFEAIGVDVMSGTPEELINRVIAQFQLKFNEDEFQALQLALEVFGDEAGKKLIPILRDGTGAFKEVAEIVAQIPVNEADLREYNKQQMLLSAEWRKFKAEIANTFTPVMKNAIKELRDFVWLLGVMAEKLNRLSNNFPIPLQRYQDLMMADPQVLAGARIGQAAFGKDVMSSLFPGPELAPALLGQGAFAEEQRLRGQQDALQIQRQQLFVLEDIREVLDEEDPMLEVREVNL